MKLTNVARASLEELDYEDFLRQRGLAVLAQDHPALVRFKARRCGSLEEVRAWMGEERRLGKITDGHGPARTNTGGLDGNPWSVEVGGGPCKSVSVLSSDLVANAVLSLLNLCCYLLDRQLATLAKEFEDKGGFTERLYRVQTAKRMKLAGIDN